MTQFIIANYTGDIEKEETYELLKLEDKTMLFLKNKKQFFLFKKKDGNYYYDKNDIHFRLREDEENSYTGIYNIVIKKQVSRGKLVFKIVEEEKNKLTKKNLECVWLGYCKKHK